MRRRTTLFPMLFPMLLWTWADSAAAAPTKVLLLDLSDPAVSAAVRSRVGEALASGMAEQGKLDVVRGDSNQAAAETTIKRVEALLDEAKALVRKFKDRDSLDRLREAERIFRQAAGHLVSVKLLIEILLARAKIHIDAGRNKKAAWALTRVAILDPSFRLHPGKYVPFLVQLFDKLRAALKKRVGQLRIKALPASLPVWVDGKRRGTAPALLTVPAGEHLVAVGFERATAGIMILAGEGRTTEVKLRLAAPDDNTQRSMATAAGATWVAGFVVSRKEGKFHVRLRLLPTQLETPQMVKSKPFDESQSTWAVGKLVLAALPLISDNASVEPKPGDDVTAGAVPLTTKRSSIFRKWWFWTAVGAVVAAGGVTTAVLLAGDSGGVRLRVVP